MDRMGGYFHGALGIYGYDIFRFQAAWIETNEKELRFKISTGPWVVNSCQVYNYMLTESKRNESFFSVKMIK